MFHTHLSLLPRSLDTPSFLYFHPCPFVPLSSGSFLFSYLSITYLVPVTFMVKPICNRVISPAVSATCFTACPRSATRSAHNRHCLVVSNVVPGFVLTLLITFPQHRLIQNVDNASLCLSPTTVSKLRDIFLFMFT